jgi:hypothetical protein
MEQAESWSRIMEQNHGTEAVITTKEVLIGKADELYEREQ